MLPVNWCAAVEMGLLVKYIQESGFFLLEDLEVVDLPDWVDIGYGWCCWLFGYWCSLLCARRSLTPTLSYDFNK